MDRVVVHEYVIPRGPVTHRECSVPRELLEYILGVDLEEEQTEYWMDVEQYNMLLDLPDVRPNLTIIKGGKCQNQSM